MVRSFLIGSSIALLLRHASAQDYDTTVCDKDRFGDWSDPVVYLPNAWNEKKSDDGYVCMSVDNSTPAFDVTWKWPDNIEDVHAFPYVRLNDKQLPTRLSNVRSMKLKSDWIMTLGNPSPAPRDFSSDKWTENKEELSDAGATANAAWDFFLDKNRSRTHNPVDAEIEVMIWLGKMGPAVPLGEGDPVATVKIGDHEFDLLYDLNFRKRHVFTWITSDGKDINEFDEDVSPLLEKILENPTDIDDFPEDPWLGIVEFGSEQWFSDENVTYSVSDFAMELDAPRQDGDGDDGDGNGGSPDGDGDAAVAIGVSALGFAIPCAVMLGMVFGL